ncbi:hypothetical protein M0R01_03735 [bacterium]|nr:hypothetical protein [bacterium]
MATETDLGGLFLELMAMKLANEYEKLMIHGNKIGQNTSRAKAYDDYDPDKVSIDPTFIKTDGIISLAVADGIQVDCSTWETKYFNPEICKEMLMAIAEEQQFLLQSMQFMVSPRAYEDFYEHCENKGVDTASLQWVLGTMPIQYHKKLIHGVPLWDNNPRQVKKAKITSSGGTVDLPYVPIVEDSDKFIPHTEGTFYTPYVNGTADDYTLDLTTGKVTHTGTDTSSIPLDTFINFTYKGPGVAVMTFPGNFKFAVNTDTVKIEHDRVVNDATDLYVSHTSGDIAMWRADACVWTNVQNKTPTLAS